MNNEPDSQDVLFQIRELLKPIAHHYQAEYDEWLRTEREKLKNAVSKKVTGKQSRAACLLMDGKHSRADIRSAAGIASSNLSVLITELRQLGAMEDGAAADYPQVNFSSEELAEAFR